MEILCISGQPVYAHKLVCAYVNEFCCPLYNKFTVSMFFILMRIAYSNH